MRKPILELRSLPDFSERCAILPDSSLYADPRLERIRPILELWRQAGGIPDHKDLNPFAFGPSLAPYLVLFNVIEDGADYEWRVFGTRHETEYGANLTGVRLSSLVGEQETALDFKGVLDTVMDRKCPIPFELSYSSRMRVLREAVGFFMPMTDGGPKVELLFGASDWVGSDLSGRV